MALEMVDVYDLSTGKITRIPKCELAVGMVKVKIKRKDGEYWVSAADLNPKIITKHSPFEGELKKKIEEICLCLSEVHPLTYKEWEDGFRCDTNPQKEIELWHIVALKFHRITEERHSSLPQKEDIYAILVSVLVGDIDAKVICPSLSTLDNEEVQEVIDDFLNKND